MDVLDSFPLVAVVITAAFLCFVVYAVLWEEKVYTTIADKWWQSETRVTYTVTELSCDTSGNCSLETDTKTRCRSRLKGFTDEIEYPAPGCTIRHGDTVRNTVSCHVAWVVVEDDRSGVSSINCNDWKTVRKEYYVHLTLNYLGDVRRYEVVVGR